MIPMRNAPPRRAGLGLLAAVWLIYSVCPPFLSYDSYWTLATAVNLLRHGSAAVDEMVPAAPREADYGLECVPAEGPPRRASDGNGCPGGHWYSLYPAGGTALVVPLLAAMKAATAIAGPLVPHTGIFARHQVAAFFRGDLLAGRPLAELWCASTIGALAVLVHYRAALLFLSGRAALSLALLFAFGTSQWSVASRNLFPQGLTVLLLGAALYLLLRAREDPRAFGWAGFVLALAFTVRPSNAIWCAAIALYVAIHERRHFGRFVLFAAPVAAVFFGYYLFVRHALIPLYVRTAINPYPAWAGAAMHLFSPSRGLFVFTPIVLAASFGAAVAWRRRWCFPLAPYLMAIAVAHTVLIAHAWPGHGYGPRFFADLTPLFMLFLIPAIEWWRDERGAARRPLAIAFLALAAWGVFVHARGATSIAANQWSALPQNVDTARWRVWDWSDPQFLRGLK